MNLNIKSAMVAAPPQLILNHHIMVMSISAKSVEKKST
jgi:hypothetical protein